MGDTMYGRFEAEKKKDIEWAYKKMTAEEKNDLMRKWQSSMRRTPMTMNARHPARPPCI
jgi:hypothetical protein